MHSFGSVLGVLGLGAALLTLPSSLGAEDGVVKFPPAPAEPLQTGEASWYGPGFHGRTAADGKPFDQNALTAAHRTLPLGAEVRVRNLENGKEVQVEITDRGPYAGGRIIDLSKRAAEHLDMVEEGTAPVLIAPAPSDPGTEPGSGETAALPR